MLCLYSNFNYTSCLKTGCEGLLLGNDLETKP